MERDDRREPPRSSGFSMIELLILVAIIGILSTLATFAYTHYRNKARTVEARLGLHTIYVLEKSFERERSTYTSDLDELGFQMLGRSRYTYSVAADSRSFTARAVANLDGDADQDVWHVYFNGRTEHTSID